MICLPKNQGRADALPCPTESFALDPEHKSPAGSFGTPHVSYIISINKDKVSPIRVYVSSNKN
jgi:hypothetical protein